MGDRYYSFPNCPECGAEYELYDAPSSLMYSGHCKCGWSEPKDYYEIDEHTTALFTPEEYEAWQKETGRKALNCLTEEEFDVWHKSGKIYFAASPSSKEEA